MAEIGLYHYGARFYRAAPPWGDPAIISHFVSADTMVPSAGNVLDWNRYAYVRYNPINMLDPSGHKACSNDGNNFDSCKADTYDKYVSAKKYWTSLPGASEIETGANFPKYESQVNGKFISYEEHQKSVKEQNNLNYQIYRKELFFGGYSNHISFSGRISNEAMVSFIISGEFGVLKSTNPDSFNDHLGALSKQLHNNSYVTKGPPICPGGSCPSQKAQLVWLQAFEAWRTGEYVKVAFGPNSPSDSNPRWTSFIVDATKIIGAPFGDYDSFGIDEHGNPILQ